MAEFNTKFPPKKSRSLAKKASDKERDKTRINIGQAFQRWRALRAAKGLQLDSELAFLLLDAFEKGPSTSTRLKSPRLGGMPPEDPDPDRLGATRPKSDNLPVISDVRTIRVLPDQETPLSEELSLPKEPHMVLVEEDIIGSRASIVYEENIRQLATLAHLPVGRCPHATAAGLMCLNLPPFKCIVQQRCTAFLVTWVCPQGHVVWSWTSQPTFKFGMLAGDFMLGMNILLSGSSYTKVALLLRFMNMGVVNPDTFCKIQDTYCVDAIKELWMERRSEAIQRLKREDSIVSALPSDVRKGIVVSEEQQERSCSLDQEHPESTHIKELPFTPVPVKSEDDEEKPQSSQLHQTQTEQMGTEADGEDCGGPGPDRNSDPDPHLHPDSDDDTEDSSETDVSDGDWKETGEPHSTRSGSRCGPGEKPFSCSECGKRLATEGYLKRHMRSHTKDDPFSCTVCGKSFTLIGSLTQHMTVHTRDKRFSCSVCDKRFMWYTSLKIHKCAGRQSSQLNQTDEEPPASSSAEQMETERVPVRREDDEEKPQTSELHQTQTEQMKTEADAEDCGGPEPDRNCDPDPHLQPDSQEKTGDSSETDTADSEDDGTREPQSGLNSQNDEVTFGDMNCNYVEGSLSCSESEPHLYAHMRIHTGEKPFRCLIIDRRFAHKRHMTLHMSIHTEEKLLSCSACDKKFTLPSQLKTHNCVDESSQRRRCQTKKRAPVKESFSCTECSKHFSLKGNLKTHMRIHSGEKPFSCSICGSSFKQNVHLMEHMTIHTGEKLYKCSVCGKGFNKKSQVTNHSCI